MRAITVDRFCNAVMPTSLSSHLIVALQAHSAHPKYLTALTAVLLQAAVADPDLVQAHLADHHCWSALLTSCTLQPSTSDEHHAQCLSQLSGSDCLSALGLSNFGPASTKQERDLDSGTGTASNVDVVWDPDCERNTAQQLLCDQDNAGDAAGSPSHQRDQLSLVQHTQNTASYVTHVAQLITCFVQSQPDAGESFSTYAGADSLKALLHCYVGCAETASRPLSAPVWPAQVQAQQQQHAMLERVAQAGEYVAAATMLCKCRGHAEHQCYGCCRTSLYCSCRNTGRCMSQCEVANQQNLSQLAQAIC